MAEAALLDRLQEVLGERYQLARELGRGGMAVVFLATDLRQDRLVALKVMRPEIAAEVGGERFVREIRIAARLQHPHILGLHDSGEIAGVLYYTMPYVEGESLRQRLERERQLPLADAIRIGCQVAEALSYAHQRKIVHRDIKPGNILLVGNQALVADFGLARALAEAGGEELTKSGLAVGTPSYMSPEQASGDSHVDGRADTYALGCVVYEMLAGEPPFGGRTAQAILARHRSEPPPSLRVVRPTTPIAVQEAIERALAKVPADRFPAADDFARRLEAASHSVVERGTHSPSRRWLAASAVVAGLGLAAWGAWQGLLPSSPLDPRRVLVFPLGDEAEGSAGEGVATYVGYALEGAPELRWLEGWDWLSEAERQRPGDLPSGTANAISRRQRARYYIDGRIVRGPDSVTVVLRLHDVLGDSVVARTGASAAVHGAAIPQLGVQAIGRLLPALLEPGREVDLSALAQRRPTAIAAFLQGEHAYRRVSFANALDHYRRAVREDSSLAIAALKGAQAANWRELDQEALQLVDVALSTQGWLPHRYSSFARGLRDYLVGAGDSAVAEYRRAIALDSLWSEAWAALGETYYHLLPTVPSPDSLAEDAFLRARRIDSTFSPPLLHLAEIAIRRADTSLAVKLVRDFQRAEPDSIFSTRLELMLSCARAGPESVEWSRAAGRNPAEALLAARVLSTGGAQPACARAGFRAVLASPNAGASQQWGALLGLQSALIAEGRLADVRRLLDSPQSSDLAGSVLYLIDATVATGLADRATEVAREFGTEYSTMTSPLLWALGAWAAHRGDAPGLSAIAEALRAKADSSSARVDSLLAAVMAARLTLVRGDTTSAVQALSALRPSGRLGDLEWQPWEALAGERLTLAELLFARGDYAGADQVASLFEAPQPVIHLVFLPAALALRERTAKALRQ
ncbi:MAG: protein kinase, partial [Gemmatimonadales bacterium]|nr:protein kinase [Gemmatimonadales bacterium]